MKIISLLSWFDESPSWLSATVASLAWCDHLVAVDGAYLLFDGGRDGYRSSLEQHEAVLETAYGVGLGVTVHVPGEPWYGDQVGKRTFSFRAGALVAEEGRDWFFLVDADEVVTHTPVDLRARLAETDADVGEVTLWWTEDLRASPAKERAARQVRLPSRGGNRGQRRLVRALRGLRCERAHYVWVAERDGRDVVLRGRDDIHELAATVDCNDLRVEHRHAFRARDRAERAAAYYLRREQLGIEQLVARPLAEHETVARAVEGTTRPLRCLVVGRERAEETESGEADRSDHRVEAS